MPFIASKTEPCTYCKVDIPKGSASGWTWDRTNRGYIHTDCIQRRKASPQPTQNQSPTPASSHPTEQPSQPGKHPSVKPSGTEDKSDELMKQATELMRQALEAKKSTPKPSEKAAIDEDAIEKIVEKKLEKHTRKIEIQVGSAPSVKFDQAHFKLEKLIKLVSTFTPEGTRTNAYLHGPAGSGKSTGADQVAKAFKSPYTFLPLNPMTPPSQVLGHMSPSGQYVKTDVFDIYHVTGGVICLDEVDNTSASLGTTLNGMIGGQFGKFPHGMFKRHKDCIIIATGNTVGLGGDIRYPERRQLDGAFRDRFDFMDWPYDEKLTESIVKGIVGPKAKELIAWIKTVADEIQARRPTAIVSPRAYIQAATLENAGFDRGEIRSMVIERGVSL